MRPQINRLPDTTPKGLAGGAIDRNRPLRFRLDGRIISGFAGDTLLSAALASGIDTLGTHEGRPIGLTLRANPAIIHASLANDPQRALPMARTPALDGAELITLGARRSGPIARLFRPGRTLGLPLDLSHCLDRPWRSMTGRPEEHRDLVVVGGGVAGLSAALAGARAGLSVLLIEAQTELGGMSGLFGTQDGEDSPEDSMARLAADVRASDAITVWPGSRVFALRRGLVRVHRVETVNGAIHGRVIDVPANHIVLATGSLERLPIFAGNRLPGVTGTLEAFELARNFGVWPGQSCVVATSSNPAYRLAMLAADAGVAVGRIMDTRPQAASRFIEFSRAYGIIQSPGTVPVLASMSRSGPALSIKTDRADAPPLPTDRLIVCGGWQPDLTLWHVAGGKSHWRADRHRIEALGPCDGLVLAGSAAGYLTRRGCIQSGADAIDQVLGRSRRPVEDTTIDPIYESPDAPASLGAEMDEATQAYLDGGTGLLQRPAPTRTKLAWPTRRRPVTHPAISEAPQPLAICDVAAGVDLGLIPPEAAGVVAQERVTMVPLGATDSAPDHATPMPTPTDTQVPAYLAGRFGPDARVVRLTLKEARAIEPGALIYRSSDASHPLRAIGVVLRQRGHATFALVSARALSTGLPVSIRERGQVLSAKLEAV